MDYQISNIKGVEYSLLDLDQKEVEKRIIADMEAGVDVYYDRRWEVTAFLTEWLENNQKVYAGRKILILGAGVGAESLVLGRQAETVYLNDLSPVALELCAEQMEHNGLTNYHNLLGSYQEIELPRVDLVVASFLVYNRETLDAIQAFMSGNKAKFILMNEKLKEFKSLLKAFPHEVLFEEEGASCVMFDGAK